MLALFAVGVVTGTILSFELGLLWPVWIQDFGNVFGLGFTLEGFSFFLEAIFIGIYAYGWDRLRPRTHFLSGIPIAIAGVAGSLFVIAVNGWMNHPTGFTLVDGKATDELDVLVDKLADKVAEVIAAKHAFVVYALMTRLCGATFVEVDDPGFTHDLPERYADAWPAQRAIMAAEMAHNLGKLADQGGDKVSKQFHALVEEGRKVTATQYLGARSMAEGMREALVELFQQE